MQSGNRAERFGAGHQCDVMMRRRRGQRTIRMSPSKYRVRLYEETDGPSRCVVCCEANVEQHSASVVVYREGRHMQATGLLLPGPAATCFIPL